MSPSLLSQVLFNDFLGTINSGPGSVQLAEKMTAADADARA